MTVIVWDGKTLAGDRQSSAGGMRHTVRKVHRIVDEKQGVFLVGGAGSGVEVSEFMAWLCDGSDPAAFPLALRDDKCDSMVIVITPDKKCLSYEDSPYPVEILDRCYAIGSGRDYAMATLHLGFDIKRAVEVACELNTGCGLGVDMVTHDDAIA